MIDGKLWVLNIKFLSHSSFPSRSIFYVCDLEATNSLTAPPELHVPQCDCLTLSMATKHFSLCVFCVRLN